jgi:hypothetical protein
MPNIPRAPNGFNEILTIAFFSFPNISVIVMFLLQRCEAIPVAFDRHKVLTLPVLTRFFVQDSNRMGEMNAA